MEDFRFVGREKELKSLEEMYQRKGFDFTVVYGRRRIGKTELIKEFVKNKKCIRFTSYKAGAQILLTSFCSQVGLQLLGSEDFYLPSFEAVFRFIAKQAEKEKLVLVLDEFPYLAKSDESVISLLQVFCDNEFKSTQLKLILSGSSKSFMEDKVLGEDSPLYGRRTLQIKLKAFSLKESAMLLSSWDREAVTIAHSICGGVPLYLNYFSQYNSVEEALKKLFFTSNGILCNEAQILLQMEGYGSVTYNDILTVLSSGTNEVKKIAEKIRAETATVSAALKKLKEIGICEAVEMVGSKTSKKSWSVEDDFFRFFYAYVQPYTSLIDIDYAEAPYNKMIIALPQFVGKAIEKECRVYVLKHSSFSLTRIGFCQMGDPETRRNEEVDIVGYSADKEWCFGECKWRNTPCSLEVYNILLHRSFLISSAPEREYWIISKSGFSDELKAVQDQRLHLVDFDELFI